MRILIIGSAGFIGNAVKEVLSASYEVYGADRVIRDRKNTYEIDLMDKTSIVNVLRKVQPQVVINCAGVVDNSDKAQLNVTFTANLLEAAKASGQQFERIIISGSAAEYGLVDAKDIPVSEDVPLNANSGYGLCKLQETSLALEYGGRHGLPVVVARIFNPIGLGMRARFLISNVIEQIEEVRKGTRNTIEVSRLDSRRDYINVRDIARAFAALAEGRPKQRVYNLGSGRSTSNEELIKLALKYSGLKLLPKIVQTSKDKEPLVAIQADITRIMGELNWEPTTTLDETLKEIMHEAK